MMSGHEHFLIAEYAHFFLPNGTSDQSMIHAGAFFNATTLCMSHVYSISYCQANFNVDDSADTTETQFASVQVGAAAAAIGYKPTQMTDAHIV